MTDLNPQVSPYELIGGESRVRELVDRFYDHMEQLPEVYNIRKMHPPDMSGSRDKLFKFLSGWLGGPQLYIQEYGHPRLRARHLPFSIDDNAKDQWLHCMQLAMDDMGIEGVLREHLDHAFEQTAAHMRNQTGLMPD